MVENIATDATHIHVDIAYIDLDKSYYNECEIEASGSYQWNLQLKTDVELEPPYYYVDATATTQAVPITVLCLISYKCLKRHDEMFSYRDIVIRLSRINIRASSIPIDHFWW